MKKIRIILLSGGSGKRLWPLSNGVRSKQFLKLLRAPNGEFESMVQRIVRQINEAKLDVSITIATGASQKDAIINQLGSSVEIVTEPERRDTFPAIALASMYLLKEKQCLRDEVAVVMPIDPFTELGYFEVIKKMAEASDTGLADLVLMGIRPTEPSSKFGYIVPAEINKDGSMMVSRFAEKPDRASAEKLISDGALWNGGVFAFKLGYMEDIVKKYFQADTFEEYRANYNKFPKISFDYEVAEKADSIAAIPFCGKWKDLGTWNSLTEEMSDTTVGNAVMAYSENSNVINELEIPVVALGLKDIVVSASLDGILVSDKSASVELKNYVDNLTQRPMFEERRWGAYKVIDYNVHKEGHKTLTKHLILRDGCGISYQRHKCREEIWTFVSGTGALVIDNQIRKVSFGDVVRIKPNQMHAIRALGDLHIIEVQIGTELTEEDIERFDYDWDSALKSLE